MVVVVHKANLFPKRTLVYWGDKDAPTINTVFYNLWDDYDLL